MSTFIFNTSEFIPIGLLSGIASDFAISESQAGLLITVYAWVVAIASLPLMLVFAKTENRRLMLSIVALFVFSHILSGVAANYNMLMISRMGVACSPGYICGDVYLFRNLQCRYRDRGSCGRFCLLGSRHPLYRICRRGNRSCCGSLFCPQSASAAVAQIRDL